jgi:hypothetical protein
VCLKDLGVKGVSSLNEIKIIVQTEGIEAQFRLQHIGGLFIEINKL